MSRAYNSIELTIKPTLFRIQSHIFTRPLSRIWFCALAYTIIKTTMETNSSREEISASFFPTNYVLVPLFSFEQTGNGYFNQIILLVNMCWNNSDLSPLKNRQLKRNSFKSMPFIMRRAFTKSSWQYIKMQNIFNKKIKKRFSVNEKTRLNFNIESTQTVSLLMKKLLRYK